MSLINGDQPTLTVVTGTWAPTLLGDSTAGAPTYTTQVGSYEKIGRLVIARFKIVISAVGGMTGNLDIGALPFTSTATTNDVGAVSVSLFTGLTLTASYTHVAGDIQPSGTIARVLQSGSAQTGAVIPISGVANATTLEGVAIYRTD